MTKRPPTTRLKKYKAQPQEYEGLYGKFTLTERDFEMLETVYAYRHITSDQLRAVISGSAQQISRRLQGLFHNGFLARYVPRRRMRGDLETGSPVMAYGLETKGYKALTEVREQDAADSGEDAEEVAWKKAYSRRQEWFLEHAVMISNVHATLDLALRGRGEPKLVEWDQSRDVRGEVTVSFPRKGDRTYRIAPDAHFAATEGTRLSNFFLEADRATEESRRIYSKFVSYWWYLQSEHYLENYENAQDVRVLFVTTTERRLENLMKWLGELEKPNSPKGHGGFGWFWFTSEERFDLAQPESILEPIWQTVTKPDRLRVLA